ncbi:SDR family NAD(P)-dependent oxidoreductase [Pseudoalteromonas luteoviolacea]|uniref:SDR family NAD(P)-dependent oxidoreductase n=1 Tax=Pseudoalteromonas luteoviolacea TaxID=43657 RepID=UPI00114EA0BF|nr:SDR family oxidoreductase [Pseudoalteromonas luteoviolacea]TQF68015.1 SDR family oxidoreductase [Pseudoalteromonas luteoviolacea]
MANTALITGASGGIGLELAHLHAQQGGDVVLVARSEDKLKTLASEIEVKYNVSATVISEDLSDPLSAQRIFDKTEALNLQIDVLINNAGFGGHGIFYERERKLDQQMIQVNITTLTDLTHLFVKGMVARKSGRILNVSSTVSFLPGPLQAVYYATKAFVTSYTQAIAEELSGTGVTATALCPGAVDTGFVAAGNLDGVDVWKNARSARSVAECGYKAMQQGKLVAFNELKLQFLLNWVTPFLPRKMVLKLSRQSMEK